MGKLEHPQYPSQKETEMIDTNTKISTLWIIIVLNMIFADIFSIIVDLSGGGLLKIPGDVEIMMWLLAS